MHLTLYLIFYLFSHRNFKEIQQRKSNPKNCITSKARGLLQDVTQMAFISQVDMLFCKIALLKNMLLGKGSAVLKPNCAFPRTLRFHAALRYSTSKMK